MIKKTVLAILTLLCASLVDGAESKTLLVRLEVRFSGPDLLTRHEVFVYQDGNVLRRAREISFGGPPTLSIARSQASEAQMAALRSALQLNQVGFQTGGCSLRFDNPPPGYSQAQVDWFGKGLRQNSFVADSKFPEECSSQIHAIVAAIEGIAASAPEVDAKRAPDLIEAID